MLLYKYVSQKRRVHNIRNICFLNLLCFCNIWKTSPSTQVSGLLDAWVYSHSPDSFHVNLISEFSKLPLSGNLKRIPWSDSYWQSNRGGIAYRYMTKESLFNYKPYTQASLNQMTPDVRQRTITNLSPAEKWDLYHDDYSYPTIEKERMRTSPSIPEWEGLCTGWTAAAINFTEPKPITVKSPKGLEIFFGSSDIKALLSYTQFIIENPPKKYLGSRCSGAAFKECQGANAGAFHIILTNYIALKNLSFIVNLDRNGEIWNQPVRGFKSRLNFRRAPSSTASPQAVEEVGITTNFYYSDEVDAQFNPVNLNNSFLGFAQKLFVYTLELNASGEIVGGEWISPDRPGFLWIQDPIKFLPPMEKLKDLYSLSIL